MTHPVDKAFIRQGKDYHTLICYQKAVCIYDITYYFAHKRITIIQKTTLTVCQHARQRLSAI